VVSDDSRLLTVGAGSAWVHLPSLEEGSWASGGLGSIMGQGIHGSRISRHWPLVGLSLVSSYSGGVFESSSKTSPG
jgi:hypothetical protein